jgi:hypothetical protein
MKAALNVKPLLLATAAALLLFLLALWARQSGGREDPPTMSASGQLSSATQQLVQLSRPFASAATRHSKSAVVPAPAADTPRTAAAPAPAPTLGIGATRSATPQVKSCHPGQNPRGQNLQFSADTTREACKRFCANTKGCIVFDVSRSGSVHSCRLSSQPFSTARSDPGPDRREVCSMTELGTWPPASAPAALSPPPMVHTSATTGLDLGTSALTAAQAIHKQHSIVLLMLLNSGYIRQGKSWICNVKKFAGVLDKTLILTTDVAAFNAFKTFDPTLHVMFHGFGSSAELKYGQVGYWKLMQWRARLLQQLLDRGVRVLVAEADQIWFVDVIADVLAQADSTTAFMCLNDLADRGKMVNGGFQYIAPAMSTVWKEYVSRYDRQMARHSHKSSSTHIGDTSDQIMLNDIMKKVTAVDWKFLDPLKYVSGKWYIDKDYAARATNPKLSHNNWIIGNDEKEKRAKARGQWFLDENDQQCK